MALKTIIQGAFFLLVCGYVCDADLDKCSRKACRDTNMCQEAHGVCTCQMGYSLNATTGLCDDLDECANYFHDPCGHRGRCNNNVGSYICECLAGWKQTEHCSPNISENFVCMPGYSGDNCKDTVCGDHGYTKALNENEFICICSHGWQNNLGDQHSVCNTDVDECTIPGVCNHIGRCTNTPGSFTCDCYPPWTGSDCSAYNCTNGKCHNGGTCEESVCSCLYPWTGKNCAEQINDVHTDVTKDRNTYLLDSLHLSDRTFLYITFGVVGLLLLVVVVLSRSLCQKRSLSKKISASSQQHTEFATSMK
ncbi:delta-like protein 1 isoform X3 [Dreissena polymorpha]|uniref:delta-like protein 1 isoform X3 n=1 Tax=Dreissena polymorpha TaxID=45954 RepID=UPI002264E829|nr:delta-like protein 1 isoform X3 [Dreissena polymorpha]